MSDDTEVLLTIMLLNLILNFVCMHGFVYEIKKAKGEILEALKKKDVPK